MSTHTGGTWVRKRDGEPALLSHSLHVRATSGVDKGSEGRVENAELLIGSSEGCDLRLRDRRVSKRHCVVSVEGDEYRLRDLESTNGTFVDDARISTTKLAAGATFRVGSTTIKFEPKRKWVRLAAARQRAFGQMIGASHAMRSVFGVLERVAPTRLTCILMGETGTGKELAARAIHEASPRGRGPFVVVDCGAVTSALFESELFGHEKGAFTGADRARPGAFELAHEGTLFLDEIGELPLALQPMLLRALERREVRRIGAPRPTPVDVRVLCATHRPLEGLVESGEFRQDLYFRLAEVIVELPALRDRGEDLALLAQRLLDRESQGRRRFDADSLKALASHHWPGNVRELRNVARRLAQLSDTTKITRSDLVKLHFAPRSNNGPRAAEPDALAGLSLKTARARWMAEFEAGYLRALLERHDWNFAAASRTARLHVKSLRRLARQYRISRPRS